MTTVRRPICRGSGRLASHQCYCWTFMLPHLLLACTAAHGRPDAQRRDDWQRRVQGRGGDGAVESTWAAPHRGDVRAVVQLPAHLCTGAPVQAEIVWRRRDKDPWGKRVVVTDSNDNEIADARAMVVNLHSGHIVFTPPKQMVDQTFFVYYLPYTSSGFPLVTTWDGPSEDHNWTHVGKWSGDRQNAGKPQNFTLPGTFVTGRFWQLTVGPSFEVHQGIIRELLFEAEDGWIANGATKDKPLPVVGASSWQPRVTGDGAPYCAMDGNKTTVWDPRSPTSNTIEIDFGESLSIRSVAVIPFGSVNFNPVSFMLQVAADTANHSHTGWHSYTQVPADAISIQPRTTFDSFDPMELVANSTEIAHMMQRHYGADAAFVLFTEDSSHPVRMARNLPVRWTHRQTAGNKPNYTGKVARGSYATFQIAVYVPPNASALHNITVNFRTWSNGLSPTCINLEGVDQNNRSFVKTDISVHPGHVYSLWIGVDGIDEDSAPGTEFRGTVVFGATGGMEEEVDVLLRISTEPPWQNRGDDVPSRYTRLRWYNSQLAQDYEIVRPYTAVEISTPCTFRILNRNVTVSASGLPQQISIVRERTHHGTLSAKTHELLIAPFKLTVLLNNTVELLEFEPEAPHPRVSRDGPGKVSWCALSSATSRNDVNVLANISMSLEMDGFLEVEIALSTDMGAIVVADVRLSVGVAAVQQMGMECRGSRLTGPGAIDNSFMNCSIPRIWKWSSKPTSQLWVGSAEAGLRIFLKDSADDRVVAANGGALSPEAWGAAGSGGARIEHLPGGVNLTVFTGAQTIGQATRPLRLFLDMAVTPFKSRNETDHWISRYFQIGYPSPVEPNLPFAKSAGASVINVHQGVPVLNQYISYPFVPSEVQALTNFTSAAASMGFRGVKFYYTIGELSNHAAEIWVSRMLGNEVYATPDCGYSDSRTSLCGGSAWQLLHLEGHYQPSWQQTLMDGNVDAANRQVPGAGRWSNYYIEGLAHSVRNAPHISGVYSDGAGYTRTTMKRMRKVLERETPANKPRPLIDFHSGNDFQYGHNEEVDDCAFSPLWAYADSLWVGESYNYHSNDADYWLIRMSGLSFGIFADMLGDDSFVNPYRGMVFGQTARAPQAHPQHMWALWDSFGIQDSDMVGWWQPEAPVRISSNGTEDYSQHGLYATSYVVPTERTLVAVASWAKSNVSFVLSVSWDTLRLNSTRVSTVRAPAITGLQCEATWAWGTELTVSPGQGILLVLEHSSAQNHRTRV